MAAGSTRRRSTRARGSSSAPSRSTRRSGTTCLRMSTAGRAGMPTRPGPHALGNRWRVVAKRSSKKPETRSQKPKAKPRAPRKAPREGAGRASVSPASVEGRGQRAPRAANLRVLMVASACAPFAKTGGLADAVAGLSGALTRLGHDVTLVLPDYRGLSADAADAGYVFVPLGFETRTVQ